jgi:hypothetical protein
MLIFMKKTLSNFASPFENSTTRITIANETLALTELISMPPFNEETVKKPHLCPNCGKILSGLTSYRRHLVKFKYSEKATKICQNLQTGFDAIKQFQMKFGDFVKC